VQHPLNEAYVAEARALTALLDARREEARCQAAADEAAAALDVHEAETGAQVAHLHAAMGALRRDFVCKSNLVCSPAGSSHCMLHWFAKHCMVHVRVVSAFNNKSADLVEHHILRGMNEAGPAAQASSMTRSSRAQSVAAAAHARSRRASRASARCASAAAPARRRQP
jgi:hypothetical protein